MLAGFTPKKASTRRVNKKTPIPREINEFSFQDILQPTTGGVYTLEFALDGRICSRDGRDCGKGERMCVEYGRVCILRRKCVHVDVRVHPKRVNPNLTSVSECKHARIQGLAPGLTYRRACVR